MKWIKPQVRLFYILMRKTCIESMSQVLFREPVSMFTVSLKLCFITESSTRINWLRFQASVLTTSLNCCICEYIGGRWDKSHGKIVTRTSHTYKHLCVTLKSRVIWNFCGIAGSFSSGTSGYDN